jgi:hypothetical protein
MNSHGPKADLWYGATGTGKTSQIGPFAEYIFAQTGKRTRLVTADGGGYEPVKPYETAGLLEVWSIADTEQIIEALDKACQGYWPAVKDGKKVLTKDGLDQVGGYVFEGLTSFGDAIMRRLRHTKARLSQDPSYVLKDGETEFAGGNMTYFGFVQDRLYDLVMKSHMLPVYKVGWSAMEAKGEEEGTKMPTFGPAIAGKKSIGKAPQWFGNCLHLEMLVTEGAAGTDATAKALATQQVSIVAKPVMYLKPHADKASKIVFPAKTRAPMEFAAQVPEYLDPPDLKRLYEMLDGFKSKGVERIKQMIAAQPQATSA